MHHNDYYDDKSFSERAGQQLDSREQSVWTPTMQDSNSTLESSLSGSDE
jgi:hypothetical protein